MTENLLVSPQTAQSLYEKEVQGYITTGCSSIDFCLKGGIPKASITEVSTLYHE